MIETNNIHGVPDKIWNRWSVIGHQLFNSIYSEFMDMEYNEVYAIVGEEFAAHYIPELAIDNLIRGVAIVAVEKWARPSEKIDVSLLEEWQNERVE